MVASVVAGFGARFGFGASGAGSPGAVSALPLRGFRFGASAGSTTATGAVTFNAVPDYETKSSYSFNVRAADASGAFNSQAVTVSVGNVAPTVTSSSAVTVAEGTTTSTVVYTAAGTDVAGGVVSFSLSGPDAAAFSIDANSGAVTFNAVPDFETKSSYSFDVRAADSAVAEIWGKRPLYLREGGSVPIISQIKQATGLDSILLGLFLPEDNLHAPNEGFSLEVMKRGTATTKRMLGALAKR